MLMRQARLTGGACCHSSRSHCQRLGTPSRGALPCGRLQSGAAGCSGGGGSGASAGLARPRGAPPRGGTSKAPRRPSVAVAALLRGKQQQQQQQQQQEVAVDPHGASSAAAAPVQWTSAVPVLMATALVFVPALFYKVKAEKGKKRQLEPWPEIPRPDADPRAYQLALARTRQALDVQKAVSFMKAGEPSRAMVELHRALEENAVCRSPLLDGHQTHAELRDLYKLHLLNTPVPHNFATLLQLRELLGLSGQEAEDIEVDVLETGTAFDI